MFQHAYDPTVRSAGSYVERSLRPGSSRPRTRSLFLDINPVNPGHVLLVPKSHHANLTETARKRRRACRSSSSPDSCRAVQAASGAAGFYLIVNNGRAAGQTVDHGHRHIIPAINTTPVRWPWPHNSCAPDELNQMKLRIEQGVDSSPSSPNQSRPPIALFFTQRIIDPSFFGGVGESSFAHAAITYGYFVGINE